MLICKGEKSYHCSNIKTITVGGTQGIIFTILEQVSPTDIADLFEDSTFYFFDEVLNRKTVEVNDKKIVGLSIKYNADSTCEIVIKLTKGVVDDES